ncbi:MAG TPA: chromosomal replication initiator DnaA [Xanthobacteraceae bacterium]|nr:chromosomal replication initiator DnaA [Xanthobacteraceae bacterium]
MQAAGARQLAFELPHAESFRREDFLADPSNEAALALVDSWPNWPHRIAAIVGTPGSGKSHLAAIWAERAGARITDAAALVRAEVPRALVTGALVIEDLAPDRADEQALFHLFNLAREEDAFVLVTAARRLDLEGYALPDLASRLRALPVIALTPPGDALLAAVMVKLFADRQLAVDEETITFLLGRIERSLAAVRDMVARLDRAALSRGRRITRVLAAELLREQESQA